MALEKKLLSGIGCQLKFNLFFFQLWFTKESLTHPQLVPSVSNKQASLQRR